MHVAGSITPNDGNVRIHYRQIRQASTVRFLQGQPREKDWIGQFLADKLCRCRAFIHTLRGLSAKRTVSGSFSPVALFRFCH